MPFCQTQPASQPANKYIIHTEFMWMLYANSISNLNAARQLQLPNENNIQIKIDEMTSLKTFRIYLVNF